MESYNENMRLDNVMNRSISANDVFPKTEENVMRSEITESWERCQKSKMSRDLPAVLLPSTDVKPFHNPNKAFLRLLREVTSHFTQNLFEYREVLYYAYEDGVIFSQNGPQDILDNFKSRNIGIGSCIFEEYMGTTAAALLRQPNEETWIIGKEHYLDFFVPYYTYCSYTFMEDLRIYTFIILPEESFSMRFLNGTTVFLKSMKAALKNYRKEIELRMKVELFDGLLDNNNQAILFIDIFAKVITANKIFCSWFQLELSEIQDVSFVTIFPELKTILDCLQVGDKRTYENFYLEKAPAHKKQARMEVTPVINNQEVLGLIITFTDAYTLRAKTAKTPHLQAMHTFNDILGNSPALAKVKTGAHAIAHSNSSVVITGESGTGKELFAQSIHNESLRRDKPFVAVNCAAIPKDLIVSELFGYVEGAFTGSKKGGSIGKFEYANGGTIFLDEISELAMPVQAILLRVLEERSITKIGSSILTPIDIRLICATNRNLKNMIKEGTFRLDLYYRINVLHLHLPPLRELLTDIPLFAESYISYFNEVLGKQIKGISQEALTLLIQYDWPGNLREFRNVMECAMNNAPYSMIEADDLPEDIFEFSPDFGTEKGDIDFRQENDYSKEERKKILALMIQFNGNKTQVAEVLGIARSTLYKKIKGYNLK